MVNFWTIIIKRTHNFGNHLYVFFYPVNWTWALSPMARKDIMNQCFWDVFFYKDKYRPDVGWISLSCVRRFVCLFGWSEQHWRRKSNISIVNEWNEQINEVKKKKIHEWIQQHELETSYSEFFVHLKQKLGYILKIVPILGFFFQMKN